MVKFEEGGSDHGGGVQQAEDGPLDYLRHERCNFV